MNDSIEMARLQNKLKNPIVALVLGFLIPGGGQMYAGSVGWGVIVLIATIAFMITIVASPIGFIIWLISLYCGYSATKKANDIILDSVSEK